MFSHNTLRNGKPKPIASRAGPVMALGTGTTLISPVNPLEDIFQVLRSDGIAVAGHGEKCIFFLLFQSYTDSGIVIRVF